MIRKFILLATCFLLHSVAAYGQCTKPPTLAPKPSARVAQPVVAIKEQEHCPCGCVCGSDCSCGCAQTLSCNCHQNSACGSCEGTWNGESECQRAKACGKWGVWLPEECPLFLPFIADPRQVDYSIGWRVNDQVLASDIGAVSFGDTWPIYQWCGMWPGNGKMRLELEGCVWAVFAHRQASAPLINADYYAGLPLTYAFDCWSFRLRLYHISSHIGDEFLLNNLCRGFQRKNPSAESLDFFVSNELTPDIRVYGGVGVVLHQDDSFKGGRFYAEAGLELRPEAFRVYYPCSRIVAVPFYAMHFRYREDFKKHIDATYVLGYEWAKVYGLCRKFRVYLEYHDGYSVEGQFSRLATNYLSIRASYGF
jgi:hypothetical protein